MIRTIQVVSAMVGAALMLSATSPSSARTHELRWNHSTYADQLRPRAQEWRRDNPYAARAQAPVRNAPVRDDPPGSAFQDQGFRDYNGD
jgi:hypothetical protein